MVTAAKAGRKSHGCSSLVIESLPVQGGQASKANSKDPASTKPFLKQSTYYNLSDLSPIAGPDIAICARV